MGTIAIGFANPKSMMRGMGLPSTSITKIFAA